MEQICLSLCLKPGGGEKNKNEAIQQVQPDLPESGAALQAASMSTAQQNEVQEGIKLAEFGERLLPCLLSSNVSM